MILKSLNKCKSGVQWTFVQKERKQEAHSDYCQRPLQANSTAHCKTVKEWNTHSFDMPKTITFLTKTNTEFYNQQLQKLVTSKALPPGF